MKTLQIPGIRVTSLLSAICGAILLPIALKADFPDPTLILDQSVNERHGVVFNPQAGAFSEDVPSVLTGSSTSLDLGEEQNFVTVEGYQGVLGGTPRTVAGWIRPSTVEGGQFFVDWGTGNVGNGRQWIIRLEGDQVRLQVDGGFIRTEGTVAANEWSHVALTFPGEGAGVHSVDIRLNGELQDLTLGGLDRVIDTAATTDVRFGTGFTGGLDDFGIWDRVLSADEIQALADGQLIAELPEQSDGLQLHYSFDFEYPEISLPFETRFGSVRFIDIESGYFGQGLFELVSVEAGNDVYGDSPVRVLDQSGNDRSGFQTSLGVARFSDDAPGAVSGSTHSIDLTAGNVAFDASGYPGVSGDDPRTVSAWVRPNSVTGGQAIVEWGQPGGGTRWTLRLDDARLRTEVQGGFLVGETELEAGEWSHVAVTFDGTNLSDAVLYVNGVMQDVFDSTDIPINTGDVADVRVGASSAAAWGGAGRWFDGNLDEVGIWSRALSETEVQSLANGALVSEVADDLELYYDFEPSVDAVITSLPEALAGNLAITLPSDPAPLPAEDLAPYLGFVVDRPATAYIAFDADATVPAWLSSHYSLSPMTVETTGGVFNLWERDLEAREQVRLLFDREAWEPGDNNAWVILSEGPDAITEPSNDQFLRSAISFDDWIQGPYNWTLTTDSDSALHTAEMIASIDNFNPDQGFALEMEIRVPRLQDAGDNAVGAVLLGDLQESIRAEWLPRAAGGGSTLRLVDTSDGTVLESQPWTGLIPQAIDNNVGLANQGDETVFSVGTSPFSLSEMALFSEDFDGDVSGWTTGSDPDDSAVDEWEIGVPNNGPGSAFVGTNAAGTNLDGNYSSGGEDNTVGWIRSPVIDLSNVTEATLAFHEFMELDPELDGGVPYHFVTVSVLDAASMEEIEVVATYNEDIGVWTERVLDLSSFTGGEIIIQFGLHTDGADFAGAGWYIDNLAVTATDSVEITGMPENLTLDGTLNGLVTNRGGVDDTSESHLTFTVSDRASSGNDGVTVFVAWDVRASGLEPDWLRSGFRRTDHFVGVSGAAGRHRLWAAEYGDGDPVTLGGASAAGGGQLPEGTNNYFVLFGDARPGLDTFYTLSADGSYDGGSWTVVVTLTDAENTSQSVSANVGSLGERTQFGLFARHPDAGGDAVSHAPVWEFSRLSIDFAEPFEPSESFEDWRVENFPNDLDNPEVSGPEATPAGDGVSNLMKYALGLPPLVPVAPEGVSVLSSVDGSEGELVLVYWKRTDITDIEYIPEVSENMSDWQSGAPHVVETLGATDGNLREVEAVGSVSGETGNGFIRLRVRLIE